MSDVSRRPLALEGIKVVDFTISAVGPLMTKALADYGAQVVKVESVHGRELIRVSAPFKDGIVGLDRSLIYAWTNTNKYSVALNLNHSRAPEVTKRLVAWGDIVIENMTPGTMEKWGLGYEELRKIKPDIIMLRASQGGQTGTFAKQPSYGFQTMALAGFSHFTGWPDREPCGPATAYSDVIAPWFGLSALLSALDYRRRTGRGQYIDLSIIEASLMFLTPALLDFFVNKRIQERNGNRSNAKAPHGAYRCSGEDQWCVIAVSNDREWKSFCSAIGNPAWTKDAKFSTAIGRKQNEDELERLIEEWTIGHTPEEVMNRLQAAGVPAGVVQDTMEVFKDPQLRQSGFFRTANHPTIGHYASPRQPYILSKSPSDIRMPAPCLGEHNEYVYVKLLGFSDDEFLKLSEEGVFE